MKYFDDLDKVINEYVKKTEGRFKENLAWTNNLKNNISISAEGPNVIISMPLYAIFIDEGRRPGSRMPPPESLYDWLKNKAIPLNAAFPIARSIGRKGIEPKPFIKESNNLDELTEKIADAVVNNIFKDIE